MLRYHIRPYMVPDKLNPGNFISDNKKFLATHNKVVNFPSEKTILDKILGTVVHNGGVLAFGNDGMLYITTKLRKLFQTVNLG